MPVPAVLDQYSTAKPLLGSLPQWIADEQERQRIASYALYEAIYWTVPQTFKLMSRGEEDNPIYIPAGRVIVETLHRYLAKSPTFVPNPAFGDTNQQTLATQVMADLAARERLYSRFNMNKRFGIIRGDWMFHLYADPNRPPGSKISVFAVDPASVFPIYNPDNIDEIIGYHIAEQFTDNDGKQYIRRLTYRKQTGQGGPSPIDVTDELYKVDDWGGPGMAQDPKPERTVNPPQTLPSPIDSLPIYHIQNFQEPGTIWGSSEMRGLERLMAAVNQSISDEELSLAMDGLGVYATDAGTPMDEDSGEDVAWNLGPGRVVELPDGKTLERVSGVGAVNPYQDHLAYLHEQMDQTTGMADAAKGLVDVSVDVSGISLAIQMAPLFSRADEKEQVITDVLGNMLFDLGKWYVAYEGTAFNSLIEATRWMPVYQDRIPRNKAAEIDELMTLYGAVPQLLSAEYVRSKLRALGYEDMPDETEMQAQILGETQRSAQITADATGARLDAEMQAELASQQQLQTQN